MSIPFASMPADDRAGPVAVRGVASVPLHLPGRAGACVASEVITFAGLPEGREHFAVRLGPPPGRPAPLVRLHSECVTGDVLGSARCDCGSQLADGLRRIAEQGGYLLYLRQEGRGIGLVAKLAAYALQDQGHDTYAANRLLGHAPDERRYAVAARMLHALGVHRIALLSNNPDKRAQLIEAGIEVVEDVPTGVFARPANRRYLEAKVRIGGHRIDLGA